MLDQNYEITVDVKKSYLHVTLSGFFDLSEVAKFSADRLAAVRQLTCGPNQHISLCDLSRCFIQTQEVAQTFQALWSDKSLLARRSAIVIGGSVARMQAKRIVPEGPLRFFEDIKSAEEWLFSDPD